MENIPERKILEKSQLVRSNETVPAGEEWRVAQLIRCEVVVESGAKLVITEEAVRNTITINEGGELEIMGQDIRNEIIRPGQQNSVKESAPQESGERVQASPDLEKLRATVTASPAEKEYFAMVLKMENSVDLFERALATANKIVNSGVLENLKAEGLIRDDQMAGIEKNIEEARDKILETLIPSKGTNGVNAKNLTEMISEYRRFTKFMETGEARDLATPGVIEIIGKGLDHKMTEDESIEMTEYLKAFQFLTSYRQRQDLPESGKNE